jgi:uncharacterized sulfatase
LETLRTLYKATVRQVDASVGRLLDTLDAEGFADDTAIVVAGDHGEEFMEHGHLSHYPKVYRELVDVPLIVNRPDGESREVTQPVSLDAIPPTVCDLLGVMPAAEWEGQSLVPALDGEELADQGPIVSVAVRGESVTSQPIPRQLEDGELIVSARDERWTYIEATESGDQELYDRTDDPDEQRNLCADSTDGTAPIPVLDRLSGAVSEHVSMLEQGEAAGDGPETGEEITARLKALGYQ